MKLLQTYARIYVENMDAVLPFYENLLGRNCDLRVPYKEAGLELASVGQVLLLAGSEDALRLFRDTQATFIVDSIDEYKQFLESNGAIVIRGPRDVPTGRNMTVKHADGSIIEYVQFKLPLAK